MPVEIRQFSDSRPHFRSLAYMDAVYGCERWTALVTLREHS